MSAGRWQSRGFTLVEALIALLVLSIGLLGVAAMQLKSLQGSHAAYQRSIASLAAQDAQERLWAEMAEAGGLECPAGSGINGSDGAWYTQWGVFLPQLDASPVVASGDCEFAITVSWGEGRFSDEEAPEFTYAVMLPGDSDEE